EFASAFQVSVYQVLPRLTHVGRIQQAKLPSRLRLGDARLPHEVNDRAEKHEQDECGRAHASLMSSNVSGGEIDQRAFAGDDRSAAQMPGDVFAEIAGRTVTALTLLAQGFQHDVVQIALQARAQAFRRAFARFDV